MIRLTKKDLKEFKEAIYKDYGVQLKDDQLYDAAFRLLGFFETLIKFKDKDLLGKGSKVIHDNPLKRPIKQTDNK